MLPDIRLVDWENGDIPHADDAALDEIFSLLPSLRRLSIDRRMRTVIPESARRSDQDLAARKTLAPVKRNPAGNALQNVARRFVSLKAGVKFHHQKFLIAAFENAALVSREWRPYYLAASVNYLHGFDTPDHQPIQRARALLQKTRI